MDMDFLLIQKMKNGDQKAAETFVRKNYPLIRQYCQARVFDRGSAEDLTQETFEKFLRSFHSYEHRGKALNYLYAIAGNLCRDHFKKKKETADQESMENMADDGDAMAAVEEKIDIERALQKLPQEFQDAVILYYMQGIRMKEIAAITGVSVSLVNYRLQRAKELLGYFLKKGENGDDGS